MVVFTNFRRDEDPKCQCKKRKKKHQDRFLENPDPSAKWKAETHTHTIPTNAYGEIKFIGAVGGAVGQKARKVLLVLVFCFVFDLFWFLFFLPFLRGLFVLFCFVIYWCLFSLLSKEWPVNEMIGILISIMLHIVSPPPPLYYSVWSMFDEVWKVKIDIWKHPQTSKCLFDGLDSDNNSSYATPKLSFQDCKEDWLGLFDL